jgi:hypothetical protein
MAKAKALTYAQREAARRRLAGRRGVPAHEITDLDITAAMSAGQLSVTDCGPNSDGSAHHSATITDSVSGGSSDVSSC